LEEVPSLFLSEETLGNEFERLREAFLRFGLSGKETEVYLALVIRGRMKASDLSRELRMHRLDVYNALKSLQAKEVVEASLSKPMTFKASPLNNVIESL
jgi:sugar-specific transcriptional regulator TrmB